MNITLDPFGLQKLNAEITQAAETASDDDDELRKGVLALLATLVCVQVWESIIVLLSIMHDTMATKICCQHLQRMYAMTQCFLCSYQVLDPPL